MLSTAAAAQLIPEMPDALIVITCTHPGMSLGAQENEKGDQAEAGEIGPAHMHTHEYLSLCIVLNKIKLLMSFPLPD